MAPMAAVVAMPEPDRAAKNAQATTATIARPPVTLPTRAVANWTICLEMPPAVISAPARIKKGTAISGKESTDRTMTEAKLVMSKLPVMAI